MNQQHSPFFCKDDEIDNEECVKCPRCTNIINPNDFSNTAYVVLEGIVNKRNELVKVVVQCNICKEEITPKHPWCETTIRRGRFQRNVN